MSDDYSILTDDQWVAVLALLERDLRRNRYGMWFIAPLYPEAGQELTVEFQLEVEGMTWLCGAHSRTLSEAILADNRPDGAGCIDELERIIGSLENTAKVLRAAIARHG